MEELKCPRCGAVLAAGADVCAQCGYSLPSGEAPAMQGEAVSRPAYEAAAAGAAPASAKRKPNLLPLVSLAIGVVILVLGIFTATRKADVAVYQAKPYSISGFTFGADFYTEIYGASETIVDELSDINGGLSALSASASATINALYFSAGMIVTAVGLGTIAAACIALKKES